MRAAPTAVEVQFTVTVERVGHFDYPFSGHGDIQVERELRASVVFHSVHDGPEVERLEKACWEELYPDEQEAAEEQAVDMALVKLEQLMREAS